MRNSLSTEWSKPRSVRSRHRQIFPVQASSDSIGGLTVGQSLHELKKCDQRETSWSFSRLPLRGEEFSEVAVVEEHAKFVVDPHDEIASWEKWPGQRERSLLGRGRTPVAEVTWTVSLSDSENGSLSETGYTSTAGFQPIFRENGSYLGFATNIFWWRATIYLPMA